jgi:hypothetical protein
MKEIGRKKNKPVPPEPEAGGPPKRKRKPKLKLVEPDPEDVGFELTDEIMARMLANMRANGLLSDGPAD